MIVSPGAKINLGLYITAKRPDGYHDLLTLFYPVPFSDSLEMILTPTDKIKGMDAWINKKAPEDTAITLRQIPGLSIQYSASGIPIKGTLENNLCIKAYRLLKEDFPQLPPVMMHLHKNVPMGAGLGGGSADGAAALQILNELGQLRLCETQLLAYAERLGSDCPFFIKTGPQLARGKGEVLSPVALPLKGYTLLLVCPPVHVPTAAAFSRIQPGAALSPAALQQLLAEGPESWKDALSNQFEASVFSQFPQIEKIKRTLYRLGATYAAMTGSGSAVFGLFKTGQLPAAAGLQSFAPYVAGHWPL